MRVERLSSEFVPDGMPRTVKGVAVIDETGNLLGVAGFYFDKNRRVLFARISEEARRRPRSIIMGWRELKKMLAQGTAPVHAAPDLEIDGSERLLEHIGFRTLPNGVCVWRC